jgi:signal transduction histidine kinase
MEESTRLKENFLNRVSHELRTPIATMKMAVQMLTLVLSQEKIFTIEHNKSVNANKIFHYLRILSDECDLEIGLISDLLDLQRLELDRQIESAQAIFLEPYLLRIVRPFEEQARRQQQSLQLEISPDLPLLISNAQVLERILVELLTNACKYSPMGETITLLAHCAPATENTPPTVMISIINSGIEIPTEQIGRIFDAFYRLPSGDPDRYEGTGLGLALVKKLALSIGGNVRAESGAGQTCFTVETPIEARPAERP